MNSYYDMVKSRIRAWVRAHQNTGIRWKYPVYTYRLLLYLCMVVLIVLSVVNAVFTTDASTYILATSFVSLYLLDRLIRTPDYAKDLQIDILTGLLNLNSLVREFSKAIANHPTDLNSPIVVMLIDITNFKGFNKSLGYALGDSLLSAVAKRIEQVAGHHTVARIGADEFAILLSSASIGYMSLCEKVHSALAEPMALTSEVSVTVGASIGISLYPEHGKEPFELLRKASLALQHAKKIRGRCVVFDRSMDLGRESLSLTNEIKRAVENGELVFYYQPKLSLRTGKICGVEALIRWQHPKHGLIMPNVFIPQAEESRQIDLITKWSLKEGAARLAELRRAGYDITLSINISPYSIINSDVLIPLTKEILDHSLPYDSLVLEITESSISLSPEEMAKIMAFLEMLGVQVSIDDFGVGHAPLLYIKHFPLREIKMDKRFVTNMLSDPSDSAIVKSTIDLAHSMGCEIVAEGVETPDVKTTLASMGCDKIQGFYVSKPLTWEHLLDFLGASVYETARPNFV